MNEPFISRLTGTIRAVLCGLALSLASAASAQLLIEVSVVAAASAQLNPAIQLPAGSYRVTGNVPPGLLRKIDGGSGFRDWEAYSARGLAARLFPAHLHQLTNSFAMAGYFEQSRNERKKGKEKHVSRVFVGDDGSRTLLYVIETPDELVWLIARGD
ncbi:MAG: hypothetical protein WD314_10130 [Trueperaceae bacterium]